MYIIEQMFVFKLLEGTRSISSHPTLPHFKHIRRPLEPSGILQVQEELTTKSSQENIRTAQET